MATIIVAAPWGGQQQPLPHPDTLSPQQLREWVIQRGRPGGGGYGAGGARHVAKRLSRPSRFVNGLFSEAVLVVEVMVLWRDVPGCVEVAALGASESAAALCASASTTTGPTSAEALHTFTLDSGASRCFVCDCTTVTLLAAPVPFSLADPTGGPVVARASTVLSCPAVPSDSLSCLHLPSFSTKLVSNAVLQDVWVDTFIPVGQRVAICTCSQNGRHLATFTRQPGSSLYTLTTTSAQVTVSVQVAASSQVFASGQFVALCSCRVLSHQTLLWHHRLGHPSLPHLCSMHSRLLFSGLPMSMPPLPRSPAPPCLPCVEGRQRAAPHSSSFPPTTTPLQTLHMDVKADVRGVLITWIRATCRQLWERFWQDLSILRLHSVRGGKFSSGLLAEFYRDEGIVQMFTLSASLQPNRIAECRIGLVMEPLYISSESSGPAEGGDPAADDTAATRRSPRLETPPGFPPRSSSPPLQPVAVETGAAGGGDTWGEGSGGSDSGGAEFGGADSGSATSPSFVGAVGAPTADARAAGAGGTAGGAAGAGAAGAGGTAGGARGAGTAGARGTGAAGAGGTTGGAARVGAAGAGGAASAGGTTGGSAGAGGAGARSTRGLGGAGAAGPGGARTRGAGAAGAGGTAGAGGAGGTTGGAGAGGTGGARAADGTASAPRRPFFYPQQQSSLPPPDSALRQPQLLPGSPLPGPAPYTKVTKPLTGRREPKTRDSKPVRARCVARLRHPVVPGTHVMALRPSSIPHCVPLPSPPASSLRNGPDPASDLARAASPTITRLLTTVVTDPEFESTAAFSLVTELVEFAARRRLDYVASLATDSESVCPQSLGGESALGSDVLEDTQFELECLAAALPCFASMLLCPEGDPDAPDIPTLRSYAEAITGEYSSQWQTAMDAEMASWKSIGTYVDEVPPPGANIVDGMWILRVKRPPGSPPAFKVRYVAQGFSQ
ncbi:unnamed protein product [Closterium sp. NIES-53]